jgi:hypothetical protein
MVVVVVVDVGGGGSLCTTRCVCDVKGSDVTQPDAPQPATTIAMAQMAATTPDR